MEEEILAFAVIVGIGVASISVLLYLDATARKSAPANEEGEAPGRNATQ